MAPPHKSQLSSQPLRLRAVKGLALPRMLANRLPDGFCRRGVTSMRSMTSPRYSRSCGESIHIDICPLSAKSDGSSKRHANRGQEPWGTRALHNEAA
jgi:hypothetical protein